MAVGEHMLTIKAAKPSFPEFTKSVTQLDYGEVMTYHRFEVLKKGKGQKVYHLSRPR